MSNKIFIKVFIFLSLFLSVMGRIQKDTLIAEETARPPTPEIKEYKPPPPPEIKEEPLKKPISGLNIVSGENITIENITESSGVWSENQTTTEEKIDGYWSNSDDLEISAAEQTLASALIFSYLLFKT